MMEPTVDKPDYIKERLKFETEFFRQISTFFLLIGTATATLCARVLTSPTLIDGPLMAFGSMLVGVTMGVLRAKHKTIYTLINDLNQD